MYIIFVISGPFSSTIIRVSRQCLDVYRQIVEVSMQCLDVSRQCLSLDMSRCECIPGQCLDQST